MDFKDPKLEDQSFYNNPRGEGGEGGKCLKSWKEKSPFKKDGAGGGGVAVERRETFGGDRPRVKALIRPVRKDPESLSLGPLA